MSAALAVVVNADTRGGGYISLPSAFKLSARCSSHATSLLTCCSCGVMYGRNIWIVNKKLSANSGRNILTIAAPSRTTTCTTGLGELSCLGTRSFKQQPRSESTSLHFRCCRSACCVVQRYQALGVIFGLLCDHIRGT